MANAINVLRIKARSGETLRQIAIDIDKPAKKELPLDVRIARCEQAIIAIANILAEFSVGTWCRLDRRKKRRKK